MTGFGAASAQNKSFRLELSVKSVNSRFLDIKFYTPSFYAPLEPDLQKLISQKGRRGLFIVRMDRFPSRPPPRLILQWSREHAQKWKNLYQKAARAMKASAAISMESLMEKEGVAQAIKQPLPLSQGERKIVRLVFQKALRACLRERSREGASLKKDLLVQARSLRAIMKKVKALSKKQGQKQIQKQGRELKKKQAIANYSEKAPGGWPDELSVREKFDREKYDINEEMVRVEEHLRHFQQLSAAAEPVGKRLEFYAQELARELNTIASKSQLGDLTFQAVEGKAAVERIREQAQNIE